MPDEYIHVTGQDGESYEILPTDALVSFLQRIAEEETEKQKMQYEVAQTTRNLQKFAIIETERKDRVI